MRVERRQTSPTIFGEAYSPVGNLIGWHSHLLDLADTGTGSAPFLQPTDGVSSPSKRGTARRSTRRTPILVFVGIDVQNLLNRNEPRTAQAEPLSLVNIQAIGDAEM